MFVLAEQSLCTVTTAADSSDKRIFLFVLKQQKQQQRQHNTCLAITINMFICRAYAEVLKQAAPSDNGLKAQLFR